MKNITKFPKYIFLKFDFHGKKLFLMNCFYFFGQDISGFDILKFPGYFFDNFQK